MVEEELDRRLSQKFKDSAGGDRSSTDGGGQPKAPQKVNIATFRGIPKKLHETLKDIAAELGVSPGELARYFLEQGLARMKAGDERIEVSFVSGGYTLYPDEAPKRPKRKKVRRPKTLQQPRSYYGVPRTVVKAVLEQSRAAGVTQGELARYLFERGIELYRNGDLAVEPVPVQKIATLYPEDLSGG